MEEFRSSRGDLAYRQELLAEFVDASGQMFSSSDVDAAFDAGMSDVVTALPLFGRRNLALVRPGGAA